MTYQQTIDYLYTQLPMFSRDGAVAFKNNLDNTYALCAILGNPQEKLKSVHIAGTNGKGSSSHMLAAILQEAGYKVGLYTSPHLYDFRERIKIDGVMCSEDFVVAFVKTILPYLDTIKPSFFEITVAMAFSYFVQQNVDIAVIETGLGGRLDSTNIIDPEVSLITNIGYDHMDLLGNTLEAIAAEKAGIIKTGRPVVISEWLPETRPVFERFAKEHESPIYFAQDLWQISHTNDEGTEIRSHQGRKSSFHSVLAKRLPSVGHALDSNSSNNYFMDLKGLYQLRNLGGVLETVGQLRKLDWKISEEALRRALQHVAHLTGLRGRWETVLEAPHLIADVGHNVDGIKMIKAQLALTPYKHLHLITGFVKDKDVTAALMEMPRDATYYFTKAPIARALDEKELMGKANVLGLVGADYVNMEAALRAAGENYQQGDLILVCGSVFLVAEIKGALEKAPFNKVTH